MRISTLILLLASSVLLNSCYNGRHIFPKELALTLYADEQSRFTEVNGLKVHYKEEGKGPALLLLHGMATSLHIWDSWLPYLKDHYRVIRLDIPPFGLSDNPEGSYGIQDYNTFISEFLDALSIEKCHIVGSSLGGWLAWEFTVQYPERVKKMALLCSAGYQEGNQHSRATNLQNKFMYNRFIKSGLPKWAVKLIFKKSYYNDDKLTKAKLKRYYRLINIKENIKAIDDLIQSKLPRHEQRISAIEAPTLIMWGKQDRNIDVQYAWQFQKDIPNSKLVIFEKAGHKVAEEKPQETTKELKQFLAE